jgi:hypothetical protein
MTGMRFGIGSIGAKKYAVGIAAADRRAYHGTRWSTVAAIKILASRISRAGHRGHVLNPPASTPTGFDPGSSPMRERYRDTGTTSKKLNGPRDCSLGRKDHRAYFHPKSDAECQVAEPEPAGG